MAPAGLGPVYLVSRSDTARTPKCIAVSRFVLFQPFPGRLPRFSPIAPNRFRLILYWRRFGKRFRLALAGQGHPPFLPPVPTRRGRRAGLTPFSSLISPLSSLFSPLPSRRKLALRQIVFADSILASVREAPPFGACRAGASSFLCLPFRHGSDGEGALRESGAALSAQGEMIY